MFQHRLTFLLLVPAPYLLSRQDILGLGQQIDKSTVLWLSIYMLAGKILYCWDTIILQGGLAFLAFLVGHK